MMSKKVILLGFWASPFAMRVKIALAEKGIEYESMEEDQLKEKSPLLLEMNPVHKKIPVLIHNGKPVCESFIILQYIDEVWAHHQPTLFPSDPYERARVRFWADIGDKVILAMRKMFIGKREAHEEGRKELLWGLKLLEGELGDKTYFGGETFGVLDMVIIPTSSWFHVLETYGSFSLTEECPNIVNWVNRCLLRDSVAKTLPDQLKVYEFSLKAKKILEALYQNKI